MTDATPAPGRDDPKWDDKGRYIGWLSEDAMAILIFLEVAGGKTTGRRLMAFCDQAGADFKSAKFLSNVRLVGQSYTDEMMRDDRSRWTLLKFGKVRVAEASAEMRTKYAAVAARVLEGWEFETDDGPTRGSLEKVYSRIVKGERKKPVAAKPRPRKAKKMSGCGCLLTGLVLLAAAMIGSVAWKSVFG